MAERVDVLNIDTSKAQTSVKELRNQLKQLKDVMVSCEEGTEEYNKALREAADIQHTLREQMELINASAMDFGQIVSNTTKLVGGMVAGFQAANAVMNLFGVENEDVMKSLKKMQDLMALTQALPALDKAIKGFKNLRIVIQSATGATSAFGKALISTGIGAAVAALGLLITHWDDLTAAMKRWGIIHQTTAEKLDEQKKKAEDLKTKLEEAQKAYKDWEKTTAINNLSSEAKERYNELENTIEGANKKLAEFQAQMDMVGNDRTAWQALRDQAKEYEAIRDNAKAAQREILKDINNTKKAAEEHKKSAEEIKKANEQRKKSIEELQKKYDELSNQIKLFGASSEYESKLIKIEVTEQKALKVVEDAVKKGVVSVEQGEKDKLKIQQNYAKEREELAKEQATKEREKSIELIDTSFQLEQARLQQQYDEKLISEKEFNARKKELQTTYVQDYVDNIQFILDTEKNLTDAQILDLTNKINEARASLKETTATDPTIAKAKQITEAINASALALNDFSDNPAWGNVLKNIANLTANWSTLNEKIKKGGQDAFTAYAQIAATALSAIGTLMNGLAAEQDESTEEGFEQKKKLEIAGATMNMLGGIASAWASAMNPANSWMTVFGQIAMGATMSAMMLATGIAQIQKIQRTQMNSTSAPSSGGYTPNTSSITSMVAPVQYTSEVQGASTEGQIKDTRVWVSETDITNTQNKVSVAQTEAIF